MDAARVKDGTVLVIKRISKSIYSSRFESDIGLYLSSPPNPLTSDPRNRCVRILQVLEYLYEKDGQLIMMPLLRRHYDPKLVTVGQAVELFRQTFEVSHYDSIALRS